MPLSAKEIEVIVKMASIPLEERENIIANTLFGLSLEEAIVVENCFRRIFLILDQEIIAKSLN